MFPTHTTGLVQLIILNFIVLIIPMTSTNYKSLIVKGFEKGILHPGLLG
jgi:hypothetical protein